MSKEMVISANPHETRVAILEEGQLCEYYVERVRIGHPAQLRNAVGQCTEWRFALVEGRFGLLALADIAGGAVIDNLAPGRRSAVRPAKKVQPKLPSRRSTAYSNSKMPRVRMASPIAARTRSRSLGGMIREPAAVGLLCVGEKSRPSRWSISLQSGSCDTPRPSWRWSARGNALRFAAHGPPPASTRSCTYLASRSSSPRPRSSASSGAPR